MTRDELRAIRKAWPIAVAEGRVVAFGDGSTMKLYPTIAQRDEAIASAVANAIPYRIAQYSPY